MVGGDGDPGFHEEEDMICHEDDGEVFERRSGITIITAATSSIVVIALWHYRKIPERKKETRFR